MLNHWVRLFFSGHYIYVNQLVRSLFILVNRAIRGRFELKQKTAHCPGEPEDDDPWYMQDEDDYAQHCEIDVTKLSGEANL